MSAASAVAERTELSLVEQRRMIDALRGVLGATQLIETHISCVLLTGSVAYKLKKAVSLPFLDFHTLDARRRYCQKELRINRAFAPELYLEVVPITGSPEAPRKGGDGPVLDYALVMREFAQEALASHALEHGRIDARWVDDLAQGVADAHLGAAVHVERGDPRAILAYALRNVDLIGRTMPGERLQALEEWTRAHHAAIEGTLAQRRSAGFVRACHGDLHLGNIATVDGIPRAFDAIEFDDDLRLIDVMSDVAFLVMDFRYRGRADLGARFLDRYLAITGDYDGLAVFRFYAVYRALVRAMVACERVRQGNDVETARAEARRYVDLASELASPPPPSLVVTHGFSGSGKTTGSQPMLERMGAIRIRTDVERKRLHGMSPTQRRADDALYRDDVTRATYQRARDLAQAVLAAGFTAIVDGTFLRRWQRDLFASLAREAGVAFAIAAFECDEAVLRERVAARAARADDASDAGLAVLDAQLRHHDPLGPDEQPHVIRPG
ncbi:MAG: AAA family ATPase [Burkholderiales bacterium]